MRSGPSNAGDRTGMPRSDQAVLNRCGKPLLLVAAYMGARRLGRIVLPDFVPHILGYLAQIAVNLQPRLFIGFLGGFIHGLYPPNLLPTIVH